MRRDKMQVPTFDRTVKHVLETLEQLVDRVRTGLADRDEIANQKRLIETLPLSTDDFALFCSRLQNAQAYLAEAETGAAMWELETLVKRLHAVCLLKPIEPRRRVRVKSPVLGKPSKESIERCQTITPSQS